MGEVTLYTQWFLATTITTQLGHTSHSKKHVQQMSFTLNPHPTGVPRS